MLKVKIVLLEDTLRDFRDTDIDSVYWSSEAVLCLGERRGA
jgi:hypothetical protein